MPATIEYSSGCFTEYKNKENYFICNLCNLYRITVNNYINSDILKIYPKSNIYKASYYLLNNVGKIIVIDKIINMIIQKHIGLPHKNINNSDCQSKRNEYFTECLNYIENYNFHENTDDDVFQEKITLVIPYNLNIIEEKYWDNYVHILYEYSKITKQIKKIILLNYIRDPKLLKSNK